MAAAAPGTQGPKLRLAHLGDIHIQDRRRDEYGDVLAALYPRLRAEAPDVIVVAGDVFDSKTKATANNFADVGAFLSALAGIAPVVVIPGNHDTNMNTPGALDLLTPVIADHRGLQPPRLTYWRASGVYAAHGVVWAVVAPDGPKVAPAELEKAAARLEAAGLVAPRAFRVCLFHEEVDGARLPNGIQLRDYRLTPGDFAPYDATLGGHIHQRQVFADGRAAYCSSLVQQNIGESHGRHGFLVWDLEGAPDSGAPFRARRPRIRECDIPNARGFLRVQLVAGEDKTPEPTPARPYYYEVVYDEATGEDAANEHAAALEEQYGFAPRAVRYVPARAPEAPAGAAADGKAEEKQDPLPCGPSAQATEMARAQTDAQSIAVHEALIREILSEKKHAEHAQFIDAAIRTHRERYGAVAAAAGRARIRLLRLEFDNLYCFGPGNVVDFTKLEHHLSGVVAPNRAGKTSLIDVVMFALYEATPRAGRTKTNAINRAAQSFRLVLEFELDGKRGRIEKSGAAKGKARKSGYRLEFGGADLTQGDTPGTCAEIQRLVGSYEDAQLTAVTHQDNSVDFVRMKAADRKCALARLLSLGSFEGLEKAADLEARGLRAAVKALQGQFRGVPAEALEAKHDEAVGDHEDAAAEAETLKGGSRPRRRTCARSPRPRGSPWSPSRPGRRGSRTSAPCHPRESTPTHAWLASSTASRRPFRLSGSRRSRRPRTSCSRGPAKSCSGLPSRPGPARPRRPGQKSRKPAESKPAPRRRPGRSRPRPRRRASKPGPCTPAAQNSWRQRPRASLASRQSRGPPDRSRGIGRANGRAPPSTRCGRLGRGPQPPRT